MSAEAQLQRLGIDLPKPPAPLASYVPAVIAGNMLYISGQLPMTDNGLLHSGVVGHDVTPEDAKLAARQCGLNLLAQVKAKLGSLDKIIQVVRLGAFVASADSFTDQPIVANGASDLMVEIFGDSGRHVRAAVGVNSLPRGASVEVEASFVIAV